MGDAARRLRARLGSGDPVHAPAGRVCLALRPGTRRRPDRRLRALAVLDAPGAAGARRARAAENTTRPLGVRNSAVPGSGCAADARGSAVAVAARELAGHVTGVVGHPPQAGGSRRDRHCRRPVDRASCPTFRRTHSGKRGVYRSSPAHRDRYCLAGKCRGALGIPGRLPCRRTAGR